MTLYGYELPVSMPSIDVYDTDLMKAYIAGVREQYNQALDAMNKFYDKYSDFYSTIDGDTEYFYNNTIGGASKLINDIYAQGGDPFKNPQARGLISRYIANVPVGTLNQLRRNAENKKIYDQNKAMLISKGLFNEDLENMRLKELGLLNFKSVDGDKVNVWNELSPIEDKTLYQVTNDVFKKLAPIEYLRPSTRWGYDVYGVKDANQKSAIKGSATDALSNIYGRFFYQKAANQAMAEAQSSGVPVTSEQLTQRSNEIFENMVRDANVAHLQETEKENPVMLARWKQEQENWNKKLDREAAYGDKNNTIPNVSFTTATSANSNSKFEKNLGQSVGTVANILEQVANQLKDNQWVSHNGKRTKASWIKRRVDLYKKHSDLSKAENVNALIKEGIIGTDGKFTKAFMNDFALASKAMNASTFVDKNGELRFTRNRSQARQYYNNYTTPFSGGSTQLGAMKMFTGTNGPVADKSGGHEDNQWVMNLGQGGWKFTDVRASQVGGYLGIHALKSLQQYLSQNNIKAYNNATSAMTSAASIPNSEGGYDIDLNGTMYVRYADIQGFLNKKGYKDPNKQAKYLSSLGLTLSTRNDNGIFKRYTYKQDPSSEDTNDTSQKNTKEPISNLYVELPITKTFNNNNYEFADVNTLMDKERFGAAKAEALAPMRQLESVMNAQNIVQ